MKSIDIIHDEHRALASVLQAMRFVVDEVEAGRLKPDFRLLAAMVDYITRAPEKLHHPKEDTALFPRLMARSPEARALICKLEEDHALGYRKTVALLQSLIHYMAIGPVVLPEFAAIVRDYLEFTWEHLNDEEEKLMPLARRDLLPEDWAAIDAEFAQNFNPYEGVGGEFADLFRDIVNHTPAPYGLG
ncbi:MAG: hemerythrin domain-containing protein [Zoogloea sp.]|uniref:hemerythrin domain-containing protein n=1 Tax=Zoogloea sp. TaxID=49181 RepID=UPI003F3E8F87